MHFAVIAQPLRGHFHPLSVLASTLNGRGHRVTFVHQEEARALVTGADIDFAALPGTRESLDNWTQPMRKIRGIVGLGGTIRRMGDFTTMFCQEGPALLRHLRIDAVIADQLEPAGGLVAEHLRLPWVSTATTIPMNREPAIPPPYLGWKFDGSAAGMRRTRGGWRVSDLLMRGYNRVIARNACLLGLSNKGRMEDCFSSLLQVTQTVAELDFPRRELPASFHYTGPWRQPETRGFCVPAHDSPLVYASLGTLQGSRSELFRRIAEACRRAGLRLMLTHGGALDERTLRVLPGDPLVFDWLPQEQILEQVELVVCHGGMNTVLDALLAGKPMVVLPLAFEQAGIGARVEHAGVGIALKRSAGAHTIAKALCRLRNEPTYGARAKAVGKALTAAGGVQRTADLIERALGVSGAPSEAATRGREAPDDVRGGSRSGSR